MLDIGWTELLVIAVILIVVVGPKDLPPMIRAFGKMTKRLRQTAGEFRAQFDEALREAELDEIKNSVSDLRSLNPANTIRETLNPLRQMGQEIKSDLERTTRYEPKADADQSAAENSILPDLPFGLDEPPQELKPVAQQPVQPATPAQQPAPLAAPGAVPAGAVPAPSAATAPATSAPVAVSAPQKKPSSRKTVAKTAAPAKASAERDKAAATVSAVPAKPKTTKPKTAGTSKAAVKPASASATPAKATPRPRKSKSEDRA
jgi:sec-independent protein translocase protein TatB